MRHEKENASAEKKLQRAVTYSSWM